MLYTGAGAFMDHVMVQEWMDGALVESRRRTPTPLQLFHYTTRAGAEGILRTQSLRATHVRGLNDTTEFRAGQLICLRALMERGQARYRPYLRDAEKALRDGFEIQAFVASLSESPRICRNWYDYAENGRGYVIQAEMLGLTDLRGVRVMKVLYDADVLYAAATEAVRRFERDAAQISTRHLEFAGAIYPRVVLLGVELYYMCLSFKEARRWSHEREWRVIYNTSETIDALPVEAGLGRPHVMIPLHRMYHGQKVTLSGLIEGPMTARWDSAGLLPLARVAGVPLVHASRLGRAQYLAARRSFLGSRG